MRLRILGFSAALLALGFLGHSLVGMPGVLQQVVVPEEEEAPATEEGDEQAPEAQAPEEGDELGAEGPLLTEDEETIEALRQDALAAQRRAEELREEAQRAEVEAERAEVLAEAVEEGEVDPEELEEELPTDVDALTERMEALEARLAELQVRADISEEEIGFLEEELELLEDQAVFMEENRLARIGTLQQGLQEMDDLAYTLSRGSGDIGPALDQLAQELARASADALTYAGEEEARMSGMARESVLAARDALERQDLYSARIALGIAQAQARAARRAAETEAPSPLAQ